MKRLGPLVVLVGSLTIVTIAHGGHELPVYPSYYPQEIRIERVDPARAADLLREAKIHAYVGDQPLFPAAPPESIGAVESLGSFVVISVNPASPLVKAGAAACAIAGILLRELATAKDSGFVFHPYPVTPFHGDYLDQVDLAEAAKERFLAGVGGPPQSKHLQLKVKAESALGRRLIRAERQTDETGWDVALKEVGAAALVHSSTQVLNGWLGPPWLKEGWYQAYRLLGDALDDQDTKSHAEADLRRLETRDYDGAVERINLERGLVSALTSGCNRAVAGYTVNRRYFNDDYSAGIENIAFDSLTGFNSPMFLRTVKLKDFPWNGWLRLGVAGQAEAAWNPIGGFTDDVGHLLWSALGDPAMIPEPYDGGWVVNRVSDVQSMPSR
jgi:hypothetical protein